jgi:IS5 family transposase
VPLKAISFPTDAKLLHATIKALNRLATRHGLKLSVRPTID